MTFLLDTDVCSYYLLGRGGLRQKFQEVGYGNLALSRITLVELHVLAHRRRPRKGWLEAVDSLAGHLQFYEVDEAAWAAYPVFKGKLLEAGRDTGKSGALDVLQACIAHNRGLTVVSNNRHHFDPIRKMLGVAVEYWGEEQA